MQSCGYSWKGRASFRGRFVADCDHIVELFTSRYEALDGVASVVRNIQSHFQHGFGNDWV